MMCFQFKPFLTSSNTMHFIKSEATLATSIQILKEVMRLPIHIIINWCFYSLILLTQSLESGVTYEK